MKRVIAGAILGAALVLPFAAHAGRQQPGNPYVNRRIDALCVITQQDRSFVDEVHLRKELATACPNLPTS